MSSRGEKNKKKACKKTISEALKVSDKAFSQTEKSVLFMLSQIRILHEKFIHLSTNPLQMFTELDIIGQFVQESWRVNFCFLQGQEGGPCYNKPYHHCIVPDAKKIFVNDMTKQRLLQ